MPEIPRFIIRGGEKLGIPEILKGHREMVAPTTPYTRRESKQTQREIVPRLKWFGKYMLRGGGVFQPKFRERMAKEAEGFAGFGSAYMPLARRAAVAAVVNKAVGVAASKISKGVKAKAIIKAKKTHRLAKARATKPQIKRLAGEFEKMRAKADVNYFRRTGEHLSKGRIPFGRTPGSEAARRALVRAEKLFDIHRRSGKGIPGTTKTLEELLRILAAKQAAKE